MKHLFFVFFFLLSICAQAQLGNGGLSPRSPASNYSALTITNLHAGVISSDGIGSGGIDISDDYGMILSSDGNGSLSLNANGEGLTIGSGFTARVSGQQLGLSEQVGGTYVFRDITTDDSVGSGTYEETVHESGDVGGQQVHIIVGHNVTSAGPPENHDFTNSFFYDLKVGSDNVPLAELYVTNNSFQFSGIIRDPVANIATNQAPFNRVGNSFLVTGAQNTLDANRGRHAVRVWGQFTNTVANNVWLWLTNETDHSVAVLGGPANSVAQTNGFNLMVFGNGGEIVTLTNKFTPGANLGIRIDGSQDVTW